MGCFKSFSIFFSNDEEVKSIGNEKLVSFWISKDGGKERGGLIYRGSEEGVYHTVLFEDWKYWCSCAGYQFRGICKHVKWALKDVKVIEEKYCGGEKE